MSTRFGYVAAALLACMCTLTCEERGITPGTITLTRLNILQAVANAAFEKGLSVENVKSVDDVLDYAVSRGVMSRESLDGLDQRRDGWQNEFHLVKRQTDGITQLKFISAGKNGVYERGMGDDMVVIVNVPSKTPARK
jgi:hypothetical protein